MPGPAVLALQLAADPGRWVSAGFTVAGGRCRVGATALILAGGGEGLRGWMLGGADGAADIDGIPTAWSAAGPPADAAPEHPNGALAVDHVVLATPDLPRTVAALEAAGMVLRRERDAARVRQAFFRHGEAVVEVVGPPEPTGPQPAALWGLTLTVGDLDAAAARLGPLAGEPKDAVQPGRRILTVAREAGLGTRVALMSPDPEARPRS